MDTPGGEREGPTTLEFPEKELPHKYCQVGESESLGLEAGIGVLLLDAAGEELLNPSCPALNKLSD